jgi:ABC-type bacteriocin/lantibiotic exporter with double-glycine peptidase domain
VVTFAIYVIISVFWKSETLLAAQAFTSVALVSLLTTPVIVFIQVLPQVVQCLACFDRIDEYCSYGRDSDFETQGQSTDVGDVKGEANANYLSLERAGDGDQIREKDTGISISGESFAWDKGNYPVLFHLKVEFPVGTISVVVGPVASGKSSFLKAILGEMTPTTAASRNTTKRSRAGGVAYCSQEPWLENTSIRQNILGTSVLDEKWYQTVKAICGLDPDIAQLPRGDDTRIGSRGLNLSGGQKQRVVSTTWIPYLVTILLAPLRP